MHQGDQTSGKLAQGAKRQCCCMSDFKFGFRDVLEPAKKQKKLEEQALAQEEKEIHHRFLLMNEDDLESDMTVNEEIM